MENDNLPTDAPSTGEATDASTAAWPDPDMVRLIELVERIGGHGEQPL